MKLSLMKKLSIGFLLSVIGSLIIASFISNNMIEKKFNNYLVDEQKAKVNKVVNTASDLYDNKTGFSDADKDELQRYAVSEELYMQVKDLNGKVIFDSGSSPLQHQKMMQSMMGSMMNNSAGMNLGDYTEETHTLTKDKKNVGSIIIGYFGASFLTQGAMAFKMTLNNSFIISALIALVFGLAIGFILSRQISSPLVKITNTANMMREGNLEVRSDVDPSTKEIEELSNSINYLAETLQNQENIRKRLTSDMAHEIRTPLTTLKTHVEALMDGIWEPTPERFESFYEEINRLIKLVENLRHLAKLEQSNLNLNKSKFNLSNELDKIIETFLPLYTKSNYELISDITPNIIVLMDKDKLKQIMHNLLSNAHKYLKVNGKAEISLKLEKESIVIRVTDNGIGISEKDLPHIFERLYRADVSRTKTTGGSGIGLTITKALVEAHGGKIFVESISNVGSTFTVSFPKSILG